MIDETKPKFTPEPWRRTITTVPCVTEGYDTSSDIVNLTIGNRNIPLAAVGMNSTVEGREFFAQMVANADLMAAAPDLYANERKNQKFLGGLRDFFAVMAEDADIAKIAGLAESMREWKELLDSRMADIAVLLARARGEEEKC